MSITNSAVLIPGRVGGFRNGQSGREKRKLAFKDGVHGGKVGADGHYDHGECEGEELEDDISLKGALLESLYKRSKGAREGTAVWCSVVTFSYNGTAGLMSDCWLAAAPAEAGLVSTWSS